MKVNFKVKMKVTIEFLVEIYYRNDLHFFEKYFTYEVCPESIGPTFISPRWRYSASLGGWNPSK